MPVTPDNVRCPAGFAGTANMHLSGSSAYLFFLIIRQKFTARVSPALVFFETMKFGDMVGKPGQLNEPIIPR